MPGRCLWSLACLAVSLVDLAFGEPAADPVALVRQLGDDAYAVRHLAAGQLAALGLPARDALVTGLKSKDPAVRRHCRWILADVLAADFQRRLAAFVADRDSANDHGLAGWSRYRRLIGGEPAARRLFVQMQRAEGVLLEAAAEGGQPAVDALQLRLGQVFQATAHPNPRQQRQPSLGTVAALLFVASDRQIDLPSELPANSYLVSLCQQGEFQEALADRDGGHAPRKLLGQWVLRPAQPYLAYAKLSLAVQYDIKEGIVPALRILRGNRKGEEHQRTMAIIALGWLGGKDYAAVLHEQLDDRAHIASQQINNKRTNTEVRDVALAWLIHLTAQDHAAYGQEQAEEDFAEMGKFSFHGGNCGFADKASRDNALKKWKTYVAQHPLPAVPTIDKEELPPPGKEPAEEPAEPKDVELEEPPSRQQGLPLPPAEREHVRNLTLARQFAAQRQYVRAARLLDGILAAEADSVFASDREIPLLQSLHCAAERVIADMPAEGRQAYEDQYGSFARRALREAVAAADSPAIAAVAARYFHTRAGAEAAYLSAAGLVDQAQPLQAAVALQRIRTESHHADRLEPALSLRLAKCWGDAGLSAAAEDALRGLPQRDPGRKATIGGQRREMAARPEQARDWFESLVGPLPPLPAPGSWTLYRGGPARNAASQGVNPDLHARPLQTMCDSPAAREIIDKISKEHRAAYRAALPKLHPLVVGNTLVLRTATHLVARDLADGRLLWDAPLDDTLRGLLSAESAAAPRATSRIARVLRQVAENAQDKSRSQRIERLRRSLQARCWEDLTFGTLSSDGRRVFGVEDLALTTYADEQRSVVDLDGKRRPGGGPLQQHNLLTAYDLGSGKLAWEIGGPPGSGGEAAGALFLGPPLPFGERLFAVAEVEHETRLLELHAASGALLGSITLGVRERPVSETAVDPLAMIESEDLISRRSGAACSYADGMLVCHTGENQFVAVELATRAVRWAYQAPPPEIPNDENMAAVARHALRELTGDVPDDCWLDGSVTLAAGCSLLTPPDGDELICVRLSDGQWQWSAPRRDGRYVAGVCDGRVLLVGRSHVWALGLADGKPAWQQERLPLPAGAVPSGRGFMTAGRYYVPLSSGEVAAIDMAKGRIVSRSRSADGVVPGNLVACQGVVFSQDVTGVYRFEPLVIPRQQLRPDDAQALREQGRVLLSDGRVAEAARLLGDSLLLSPSPQTSQLLTDALIEGLQSDFDDFHRQAVEAVPDVDLHADHARLLRELALGLQRAGRHREAFETLLTLIDVEPNPAELVRFETPRVVRCDRWLAARLAESWAAANSADAAAIERLIQVGPVSNRPNSVDDLKSHPTVPGATGVSPVSGENHGQDARATHDSSQDARATQQFLTYFGFHPSAQAVRLQLAEQLAEKQQWLEAEHLLRQVYSKGTSDEQQTAVARLAALMRAAKQPGEAVWPKGKVRKTVAKPANLPDAQLGLAVLTEAGPLANRIAVAFDADQRNLTGWDSSGRQTWQVSLGSDIQEEMFSTDMAGQDVAVPRGHLVLAWLGGRLYAADGFGGRAKPLWNHPTVTIDPLLSEMGLVGPTSRAARSATSAIAERVPLAATADCVCFLQENKLLAVDPLSGEVLWMRDDLRPASDVWGDDERLFVVSPDAAEAVVLSVRDGRELARRGVPDRREQLWTVGRCVVTWTAAGDAMRLTLFDPWTQETVWSRDFDAQARAWLIDGGEVAVFDPKGQFTVVALPAGEDVLRTRVAPQPTLESFAVLRTSQRYVLLANDVQPPGQTQVFLGESGDNAMPVNGRVYGIDRQSGRQTWMTEVSGQRLLFDQPCDLPVLTLVGVGQKITTDDEGNVTDFCRVLCLDARTGSVLHRKEAKEHRPAVYTFHSDPAKGRFEVRTCLGTFKFTFGK